MANRECLVGQALVVIPVNLGFLDILVNLANLDFRGIQENQELVDTLELQEHLDLVVNLA